jgi:hypothetical protein
MTSARTLARKHGISPMKAWRYIRAAGVTDEAAALLEAAGMDRQKWFTTVGRIFPEEQVEAARYFIEQKRTAKRPNRVIHAYVTATDEERKEFADWYFEGMFEPDAGLAE